MFSWSPPAETEVGVSGEALIQMLSFPWKGMIWILLRLDAARLGSVAGTAGPMGCCSR
jgi:hypothetical protein